VLEAMSLEIPVVATAQGGALEQVLDGVTGIHIPIDDAPIAAEKMEALLLDASLRKSYGKNGKERVEQRYALEVFEKNIHQLIEAIR
jgi:glycosyltransferase involved in cell wall biosynthesis